HERLDVVASATRLMQRILQQHVWRCEFIDDRKVAGLAPELIEPARDDRLVLFQIRHCASPEMALCHARYFGQRLPNSHPISDCEESDSSAIDCNRLRPLDNCSIIFGLLPVRECMITFAPARPT